MSWRSLSPTQAEAHPLYGLGGWLYLLFAFLIFAVIADAVELAMHNEGSNRPFWLIVVTLIANVVVIWAGLRKKTWFPQAVIAVVWVAGGLNQTFTQLAVAPVEAGKLDPHTVGIAGYLFVSAGLTWALVFSTRVNVTFRHRVRQTASA